MADDNGLPRDMTELLRRMDEAWSSLDAALGQLSEEQLERRDAQGWSAKDHLSHLAAWERSVAYLLQGRPRHEGLGVDEETWRGSGEDGINRVIHERTRDRSLPEARGDFEQAHQEMLAALSGLTDADIQRPYSHFVSEPGSRGDRPIVELIVGNTYEHYQEHQAWLRQLTG